MKWHVHLRFLWDLLAFFTLHLLKPFFSFFLLINQKSSKTFSIEIIESISPEDFQPMVKICVDGLQSPSIAVKRSAAAKLRLLAKNRSDRWVRCGALIMHILKSFFFKFWILKSNNLIDYFVKIIFISGLLYGLEFWFWMTMTPYVAALCLNL